MNLISIVLIIISNLYLQNPVLDNNKGFLLGNEVLLRYKQELIKDKRIALVTNSTGIVQNGRLFIEKLISENYNVKKIFTPEHGFSADDYYEKSFGNIPIISLYGEKKSFTDADISDVDVIIYDIQDVGVRFYTYTSTLYLTMRDAYKNNKTFIVCDRPSIARADYFSGFVLEEKFSSFVGMLPLPICYGMTTAELASFISGEYGFKGIMTIPMQGYNRNSYFPDLSLKWINPSPNIKSFESALIYPALCFLEGTNISEGRGTDYPFRVFGAPFLNSYDLLEEINSYNFKGVSFEQYEFTPGESGNAYKPKFTGQNCSGIKINLTNFNEFEPVELGIAVLYSLKKQTGFKWTNKNFIDKLAGTDRLRKMIDGNYFLSDIIDSYKDEVKEFALKREKYLLY